jgi:hypothetical protein
MSKDKISSLIAEFELSNITGIPSPGSRQWYLLEFLHWVIGQILKGNNPLD